MLLTLTTCREQSHWKINRPCNCNINMNLKILSCKHLLQCIQVVLLNSLFLHQNIISLIDSMILLCNSAKIVLLAAVASFILVEGSNNCRGTVDNNAPWKRLSSNNQSINHKTISTKTLLDNKSILSVLRGGALGFPAGYNPFGYGLTDLGKEYLNFDGSLDSDVGRFLSTLKGRSGSRKSEAVMKEQWLEIVRVSKTGQSMRIYRKLEELIGFCLKAGFID